MYLSTREQFGTAGTETGSTHIIEAIFINVSKYSHDVSCTEGQLRLGGERKKNMQLTLSYVTVNEEKKTTFSEISENLVLNTGVASQ